MATAFLLWLDGSPARYWAVAWSAISLAALVAVGAAIPARRWAWWRHPAVFMGLAALAIAAFRWPILADNRPYPDADESQMISGARTLVDDSHFWRSADGISHGPLAELALIAPRCLGGRLDYDSARTLGAVLAWVGVVGALLIFRRLFGPARAALLALPLLAVNAFTDSASFVQYGSEDAADALIAVACFLLLAAWNSSGRGSNSRRLLYAGLALGAAPFAKIQVLPLAAWVAIWGCFNLATEPDSTRRSRLRGAVRFTAGGLAVPAAAMIWITLEGLWGDFWQGYIVDGLFPPGGRWFSWARTPAKFVELCGYPGGFAAFLFWTFGFAALVLFGLPAFDRWQRRCAGFALGLTLAAAYAAMEPGRMSVASLQLLIFPAGLLVGIVAGAALDALGGRYAESPKAGGFLVVSAAALFLGCGLAPQIVWRARNGQPALGRFTSTHARVQIRNGVP